MADEKETVATPPTPNNAEVEQLKESIKKLEAKNFELIGKMQKKELMEVPDDYEALLAFKQKHEREQLESEGKYTEATQKLEQQYRDKSAEDKKRIEELESRNRELELIAPAMQALSEITHDPELVLNNFVPKEQIQIKEGRPVVIDGYEQLPVAEYVKNKLEKEKPYLLKKAPAVGSGAPISRPSGGGEVTEEMIKPFLKNSENLTEQSRIFKVYGVDTWKKLREIAKTR